MANYIYCMNYGGIGYVGQATGYNYMASEGLIRIMQHIYAAYFETHQDILPSLYQAKEVSEGFKDQIRSFAACNLEIVYNDDAGSCYGVKEYFEEFRKEWNSSREDSYFYLDFAEMLYIYAWRNSYARFNTSLGAQGSFIYNKENLIKKVQNLNQKSLGLYDKVIEILKSPVCDLKWSGRLNGNILESAQYDRLIRPEKYVLNAALSAHIKFATTTSQVASLIRDSIVESLSKHKSIKRKDLEKLLQEALIAWTSDEKLEELTNIILKDLDKKVFHRWNELVKELGYKVVINKNLKSNIEQALQDSVKQGKIDRKQLYSKLSLVWSESDLFKIEQVKEFVEPAWLPKQGDLNFNTTIAQHKDGEVSKKLKQSTEDLFRTWLDAGERSDTLRPLYSSTPVLYDNWDEFYNSYINLINKRKYGPLIFMDLAEANKPYEEPLRFALFRRGIQKYESLRGTRREMYGYKELARVSESLKTSIERADGLDYSNIKYY